jgi:hypothetical protein
MGFQSNVFIIHDNTIVMVVVVVMGIDVVMGTIVTCDRGNANLGL